MRARWQMPDARQDAYLPATSGWVETWRLSVNYSVGVATRYSTASEATGCRHSTSVLRVLVIIECRHPVASLAVLYWVAIMLVSFLTRLTFHTVSTVVLTSLHSNCPLLSNTLMEYHPVSWCLCANTLMHV